jgi:hypothetical protein
MTRATGAANQVARQLWEREQVTQGSANVAAVVNRVCSYLRMGITRWIGAEGYRVLLERSLSDARTAFPLLNDLDCRDEQGISAAVFDKYDPAEIEQAFVSLVGLMVDRLGRVVGEEMAGRLVEQSWSGRAGRTSDTRSEGVG